MKTSSCKAKGRNLQKHVVSRILNWFPELAPDDCTSRSMGCQGEDILLSPKARTILPISIECKNKAAFAVYKDYVQAQSNAGEYMAVLVIKQNRGTPLAIIDLEHFMELLHDKNKKT